MTEKVFAERVNGVVVGLYANRQDYTDQQPIEADSAEVLAFRSPPVPTVVSRFQARAALHLAGLLTSVQAAMDDPATPMLSRLAWQDAQEFRRTSPTVLAMAQALNLDSAALDTLFTVAAGIEA